MAKFAVVLAAAGKSTRLQMNKRKKTFLDLKGRAVWLRAAEHFVNRDDVVQTLIAVSPDDMEFFKEKFRPNLAFMDIDVIAGGAERSDTVAAALQHVRDEADFVAIHDAARPLLAKQWVDRVFQSAVQSGAAILGIPMTSTLKSVSSQQIQSTVPREELWMAQTPQVFRRQLLVDAHAQNGSEPSTDDAQLVERLGHPVQVVDGSPMNLKITTPDDFRMAEFLLKALPKDNATRALHPFADEEPRLL
jgi:2-C-methyl-D-erythritol 4-phosphate cytidylyltransferase